MKKIGKHFLKEKRKEIKIENNQKSCIDIAIRRINLLEQTLNEIKGIAERNQYGNPEIAFKLIKEKIKEVL